MIRRNLLGVFVLAGVALLIVWVARNTYWREVDEPVPPQGEAATDPFYAARRLAERLGARTQSRHDITVLPPVVAGAIITNKWSLQSFPERTARLEHWVEAGGRLVVDTDLVDGASELEHWAGIRRVPQGSVTMRTWTPQEAVATELTGTDAQRSRKKYQLQGLDALSALETRDRPLWSLRGQNGQQGVRVTVGKGSVTAINGLPINSGLLVMSDNALLFVDAVQLQRGDTIYFLSDASRPTLLALMWRGAWPLILLAAGLLVLWLWRSWPRFGPLEPPPEAARRSLAEQIRGTGQFTLRHGGGRALHAAALRALRETAERRILRYSELPQDARIATLARLTGFKPDEVAQALDDTATRRRRNLYNSLALLESARRLLLSRSSNASASLSRKIPHAD
jgi:hypothetical protein